MADKKKRLERKIKNREDYFKKNKAFLNDENTKGMRAELDEWRKELDELNAGETPTTNQRTAYEKRMEVEHPTIPTEQPKEEPQQAPKGLTFDDVLKQTGGDPQKVRDWLASHPDYKAGDITNKWLNEHPVAEAEVEQNEATSTENDVADIENNFNIGNKAADAPEENEDLKKFWDKFRAGSLRSYPWLQTIGDAIGKNARMTQDRAAILTGGQRDAEAYDTVKPEEHITDEYRIEQAYADAKAGNLDSVKKLIMNGDVTIENVAAALNMSEEDAKKVFGNYMVKDTAEARTSEANAEQAEAQVEATYVNNATTVQNNINFIDEKIREIDTAINQLQSNDYDTYLKVYGEYVNNVRGIENTGIASTATSNEGFGVNANAGVKVGVVNAGASGNFDKSWGSSNTSTGSTDVLAKQALPKAEYMAQSAMGERNAANNELIEKLEAQKAQLQQTRDLWQQTLNDAMAKTRGTKIDYRPKPQGAQ